MPKPVPRLSVRLKIENIAPLFSGTFVSKSIVLIFGPVIATKNPAKKPEIESNKRFDGISKNVARAIEQPMAVVIEQNLGRFLGFFFAKSPPHLPPNIVPRIAPSANIIKIFVAAAFESFLLSSKNLFKKAVAPHGIVPIIP